MTEDVEIIRRISELAEEEHRLELSHSGDGLNENDRQRLHSIEVALDQCWDLLRQRRARRHAGQDPDTSSARPTSVVEGYEQSARKGPLTRSNRRRGPSCEAFASGIQLAVGPLPAAVNSLGRVFGHAPKANRLPPKMGT